MDFLELLYRVTPSMVRFPNPTVGNLTIMPGGEKHEKHPLLPARALVSLVLSINVSTQC